MLRINQQRSAAGAKSYFQEGLAREDYYTQDSIIGRWGGKGAERLGLVGDVQKEPFIALADNLNPNTGQTLTQRTKDNRTVGYDFNFHCPKTVSLLYTLTKDERLLHAFQNAVRETMEELEAEVKTRVRSGRQNSERTTGNLTWAEFVHLTSRPVNGVPDPHLHAHCFVFNATYDNEEEKWKAAQFREVVRDAPYFEAAFHARLSKAMTDLGLTVERTQSGWEIAGVSREVVEKFSRRTALIEELAREKGITDAHEKGKLGATTREKKGEPRSLDALRAEWKERLTPAERAEIRQVLTVRRQPQERPISAREAVDHALLHSFERSSVETDRRVLATALKRAYGSVLPEEANRDLADRHEVIRRKYDGRNYVTTREVLAEEAAVIAFARKGRGTCRPLLQEGEATSSTKMLSAEQQAAVRHVLTSTDRVMLVKGKAGTGKTAMLKAAAAEARANGSEIHLFAPTAEASRGILRQEGFEKAETVARLLADPKLQDQVKGQVVWVDEAGLLGTKELSRLFTIAERQNARVVLMGDEGQHASVSRGDAFRLLQTHAGLHAAELKTIRRQRGEYKAAVESLARGDMEAGFLQLDRLGAIREVPEEVRHTLLAEDYLDATRGEKTALLVAPTHAEGRAVTDLVRQRLQEEGRLGEKEREFVQFVSRSLTEAERTDHTRYQVGDVVRFHQNVRGFKKGDAAIVAGKDEYGNVMVVRKDKQEVPLPVKQARHFDVYERRELKLAAGDRLRITQNGTSKNGKRLMNGSLHMVASFAKNGDIVLEGGQVIDKGWGHIAHGYCVTSHASQGKTVDKVIVAMGPESLVAASAEQFYVSVSRARESAVVFCHDKEELLAVVSQSGRRMSAIELTGPAEEERPARPERLVRNGEHMRRLEAANRVRRLNEMRDRELERAKLNTQEQERGRA